MANNENDSDWKWGQSSANVFQLINQFFNLNPEALGSAKEAEVTKALKQADASAVQVKKTQDLVNATKKTWRNQLKIGAMIHGLVRTGLSLMVDQRRQEATTTKEYAKSITETRVLSAKTQTAVEKTYTKGAKKIEQTGKDLQRFNGEVDEQYAVIDETSNQASQQR